MFYIYIIQSQQDFSYYIGYTQNLESRLEKHNNSKSGYTSRKKPWELVYSERFETKRDALKREKFLKVQKNRLFYERLILNKSGSSVD